MQMNCYAGGGGSPCPGINPTNPFRSNLPGWVIMLKKMVQHVESSLKQSNPMLAKDVLKAGSSAFLNSIGVHL